MLARMSNFTKGGCNVVMPGGARCPCTTGHCAFDFAGAGDVESLKCHTCSHRMWDHSDSVGGDYDLESGVGVEVGVGGVGGDPPPYYDEGARRATPNQNQNPFATTSTLELPTEPAQSHVNHYYPRTEPPLRYADTPLATTYNFPARDNINLPHYNRNIQQQPLPRPPPPPGRTCTANLLIGIILGFVIVATPFIAYRIVTS